MLTSTAVVGCQIIPNGSWEQLFADLHRRLDANPAVRHLLVVLTVPIVYPKIPFSESVLGGISGVYYGWRRTCVHVRDLPVKQQVPQAVLQR